MVAAAATLAATAIACASTPRPAPGEILGRRLTPDDPRGFYTLAVEHSDFHDMNGVGGATTARELRRLWQRMGLEGAAPAVDLATHVVVAFKHQDDACFDELTALVLTPEGLLIPELTIAAYECEIPLLATVHVAAVARVALPPRGFVFEWRARDRRAPPRREVVRFSHAAAAPVPIRDQSPALLGTPAGVVDVPARGECALARLDDGTEVYVVHHQDGNASVLAADRRASLYGVTGLRRTVRWSQRYRRFDDTFDEYGASVQGRTRAPLDRYQVSAAPGEPRRLRVGRRVAGTPRLVVAPAGAGSARAHDVLEPYQATGQEPRPLDEVLRSPDGVPALLDASLVAGGGEPPTLCAERARRAHPTRLCPPGSPRPTGVEGGSDPNLVVVLTGPFMVRLARGEIAEVTALSSATSAFAVDGGRPGAASSGRAFGPLGWDNAIGLAGAADRGQTIVGGADARSGPRWTLRPRPWRSAAFDGLVGDHAGVDLKLRVLSGRGRDGHLGTLVTVGAGPWLANVVAAGRWRIPTLLGLALPEGGLVVGAGAPAGVYLGVGAPVGRTISGQGRFAVELVPAALVTWRGGARELLFTLGVRGSAGGW